jgi:hypothetical protein
MERPWTALYVPRVGGSNDTAAPHKYVLEKGCYIGRVVVDDRGGFCLDVSLRRATGAGAHVCRSGRGLDIYRKKPNGGTLY